MAGMFLTPDQVKEVGKISNRCALDAFVCNAKISNQTGAVSVDMEVLVLEAET